MAGEEVGEEDEVTSTLSLSDTALAPTINVGEVDLDNVLDIID